MITFPKSEVLPVHLALLNSMCLHHMLCGSLGVIKFDIKLVVLYVFKNLPLLLIWKCLARHLGLPLIAILACDMLWLAHFKDMVLFWALDASPLVDFSSICLTTSNGLGTGNLISINVYIIFGVILMHFWGELCVLCYNLHFFSRFMLGYSSFLCLVALSTILPMIWQ